MAIGACQTAYFERVQGARPGASSGAVPGGIALRLVFSQPVPAVASTAVEIVHDAAGGYRKFADQTLVAVHARTV